MQRIAIVGLLLPHRGRTDLGRVPDPQLVVIFLEQSFKPLSVQRGFHPDASRTRKRRVKRPCVTVPMFQPTLGDLSCFGIDHCNLLKPRVKITTDNYHRSAPFIRALVESQSPSLLGPEGADDLIQSTSTVFRAGSFVFYDLGFFSSLPALTCHVLTGCIIWAGMPSVA